MRRFMVTTLAVLLVTFGTPKLVDACAGLIGSSGAVNLGRTTTLAAYHDGVEHYVTSFEFLGGGGEFGTLIPLPGTVGRRTRRRLDAAAAGPGDATAIRTFPRGQPWPAPRLKTPRSCWRCESTHSTSRCSKAGPRAWRPGPPSTASGSHPTRRKCSTSTHSAVRSSSPRSSTARKIERGQ